MPIRVLQVVTKMHRAGLETMIMNYYRAMDRSKVQFDFLLHRNAVGDYDQEIRSLGGLIHYVPRANPLSSTYLAGLDGFFSDHPEYRVVHSHIDCMSSLPLRAARKHGVPVRIAHSHSSSIALDHRFPLKQLCKHRIRREATHRFACAEQAGRWLFGADDFQIVRNAIDVAPFSYDGQSRTALRKELGIPQGSLLLGHVGSFTPVKNHRLILEAFREAKKKRQDAFLVLVGDGNLRAQAEGLAERMGVLPSVLFTGTRQDIPAIMSALDVFVMPSLYEGLPMVLVEAQASGLPCVISDAIPPDCDLTDRIARVSLGESAQEWGDRILLAAGSTANRAPYADCVKEAGFDVACEAKKLEDFYLSLHNGGLR